MFCDGLGDHYDPSGEIPQPVIGCSDCAQGNACKAPGFADVFEVIVFQDKSLLAAHSSFINGPEFNELQLLISNSHIAELRSAYAIYLSDSSEDTNGVIFSIWFTRSNVARIKIEPFMRAMFERIEHKSVPYKERMGLLRAAKSIITDKIRATKEQHDLRRRQIESASIELYRDRSDKNEKPWEFLWRVYSQYHSEGESPLEWLDQSMLRRRDRDLYRAIHAWCLNNRVDPNSLIRRTRVSIQKKVHRGKRRSSLISFDEYIKERRLTHPNLALRPATLRRHPERHP